MSLFPKKLAACVEPLTRPVLKARGLAGSRIVAEWQSIVGPQLAAHCQPEKLSFPKDRKTGGTLIIAAENGFAPELQHMQPVILERLAAYFGYQAISRIILAPARLPPAPAPRPARRATPLAADCAACVEEVDDPALKDALSSLAGTLSGRNVL